MATAKDLVVKPIDRDTANALVKRLHYSGKVVNNSQLHLGVFIDGRVEGVMQFGPSLDKRKISGLVSGTLWHEFIELNRMAFSEALPRNSESRAIAIAMRMLRKNAPQIKWVISFADATQCGDGTIYRASGFVLTGIKNNTQVWRHDSGITVSRTALTNLGANGALKQRRELSARFGVDFTNLSAASMDDYAAVGFRPLDGFQIRYIYFIDASYRARLTVPELPYSAIRDAGASMYLGEKRGSGETDSAPGSNRETGGASPTDPLLLDAS